jgi:hypothetical protein
MPRINRGRFSSPLLDSRRVKQFNIRLSSLDLQRIHLLQEHYGGVTQPTLISRLLSAECLRQVNATS